MAGEAPLDELVVANLLGELAAVTLELATTSERLTSVAIQFGKMARGWAEYAGAGVAQPAPVAPVVPPHPRHGEDR